MPFNRMPTSGQITKFPAGTFNTMVGICERIDRNQKKFGRTPKRNHLPSSSYTWRNDSGEDAPQGAIVRIHGAIDIDNKVGLIGLLPNFNLAANYAISLGPCADGDLAECTLFNPARALYEASDGTPAFGESWGIEQGSWKLRRGRYGFVVQGFPYEGKVLVCPSPNQYITGKLSTPLAAATGDTPTSGDLVLWYFNGSAFVESEIVATVWNTSDEASIPANELRTFSLSDGIWVLPGTSTSGSDGETESVTVITDWRYDSESHQVQKKTQVINVHEPGEESGWETVHQLVWVEDVSALEYSEHVLKNKIRSLWAFEEGEPEEQWRIQFSLRPAFVVDVYADASELLLGQRTISAYVVDPSEDEDSPVDAGVDCSG